MEIYLVEQYSDDDNFEYDTYDSVVVIAENEDEARKIHPNPSVTHVTNNNWMGTYHKNREYMKKSTDWVRYSEIDKLKVTHIGKALDNQEKGVVLASFNAG